MKELKIGVIGCGAIGREHVRRLNNLVAGASVVAVADYFPETLLLTSQHARWGCTPDVLPAFHSARLA